MSMLRTASASALKCSVCLRPIPIFRSISIAVKRIPVRYATTDRNPLHQERHDHVSADSIPQKHQQARKKTPQSHKPPKRRLEAASQPLRNAPSSNRGPILQCLAHTTAEKYDLVGLGNALRALGVRWEEIPEGDRDRAFVIGPWKGRGGAERLIRGKDATPPAVNMLETQSDEEGELHDTSFGNGDRGEIWVFNSGSFVTWGMSEEDGRAFLREVIRRKGPILEIERLPFADHEVEEVDFVVDPTARVCLSSQQPVD